MSVAPQRLARATLIFFAAGVLAGCHDTLAPNRVAESTLTSMNGDFVFEIDSMRIESSFHWDSLRVRYFVSHGMNACAFSSAITRGGSPIGSITFWGLNRANTECSSNTLTLPVTALGPPLSAFKATWSGPIRRFPPDTLTMFVCRPNGAPIPVVIPVAYSAEELEERKKEVGPKKSLTQAEKKTVGDDLCRSVPQKKKGWLPW
jgi:hypothetical protein